MRSFTKEARRGAAAAVASGLLAAGALALTGSAASASALTQGSSAYRFQTIDNPRDLTFNQLLGINDEGVISGYFGSGAAGHPNKGYLIPPSDRHLFISENFTHSEQTQVTGLNNHGDVAGFYTNPTSDNTDGFLMVHGQFVDLAAPGASSTMALGVNNYDEVVGTYTVGSGSSAVMHGFTWTPQHGFTTVDDPHGIGTATINGVNDHGQLVGFYTVDNGNITDGFLATP